MTRWYVITLVSMANILNNYLWATWGPISQSVYLVYGWTDSTLFWVVNVGNITGVLSAIIGIYLLDVKGIRISMIVCTVTMVMTSLSRIITINHRIATILIAIGQGLNGLSTSITMTIPCVVSQRWFKVTERTTATAISALSATLGAAGAFLLAFGVSVFLAVCCIIYLPSKPHHAPSKSETISKYSFNEGVRKLLRTPAMWHIAAVYAIPMGFYGNWSSILDVVISKFGIKQDEAGWMSFYGGLAGVAGGLFMGRMADYFKRKMKIIVIILYTLTTAMFTWFTCMCTNIIPPSKWAFYTTLIMSNIFISSSSPLFLEMSCETSYPIAEGVTAGFLGMAVNLGATVFMCVELVPNIDTGWANWALVAVYILSIPALVLFKAEYRKVDIDIHINQQNNQLNDDTILQNDANKMSVD
ncbi:Solute carrier 49 member 4 [Mactra antiquata]